MDAAQLKLWHDKREELFPTRLNGTLVAVINTKVSGFDYARALVALAEYRKEPYRGFYVDRFCHHYERTGQKRGNAAEAAPRAKEPDGIDPDAKRREVERFERLPPEFVSECKAKYGDLGYGTSGVCFAIVCNDAWDGRDVERYRQHLPYFSAASEAQRRRVADLEYSKRLTGLTETERLRAALQAAHARIQELMGEPINVVA